MLDLDFVAQKFEEIVIDYTYPAIAALVTIWFFDLHVEQNKEPEKIIKKAK